VIAIVAGSEALWTGPIPLALEHAGLEARPTETTDQAGFDVRNHGCEGCVLVVDAAVLEQRCGSATWASFIASHPALPTVVLVWGEASDAARASCGAPHRMLLENPFDAAAAVTAVHRVAARALRAPRAADTRDDRATG